MPPTPRRLYLAGPMSGIPATNFPLFNQVAAALRAQGHDVFNPAENKDGGMRRSRAYYMQLDIPALLAAEALVLLPGWQRSRGASLEVWLATDLDKPLFSFSLTASGIVLERVPYPELRRLPFDLAEA